MNFKLEEKFNNFVRKVYESLKRQYLIFRQKWISSLKQIFGSVQYLQFYCRFTFLNECGEFFLDGR
ncbi:hypothetical protein BpHYR1_016169 [Brachionus plicatilis]|uniref:Uncharacterized protein n=1 Tax=Brachionus plicatilis TaxID=10195 RepID=A0A3M7R2Q7_BRAPC|nr:hypothetical protein BpHYR1_016169 [Brachionus plicatilis]